MFNTTLMDQVMLKAAGNDLFTKLSGMKFPNHAAVMEFLNNPNNAMETKVAVSNDILNDINELVAKDPSAATRVSNSIKDLTDWQTANGVGVSNAGFGLSTLTNGGLPGAGIGAGLGALAGGGIGYLAGNDLMSTGIGAGAGALLGGAAGYYAPQIGNAASSIFGDDKQASIEYALMKYAEADAAAEKAIAEQAGAQAEAQAQAQAQTQAQTQAADPSLFQRAYANPYARTGIGAGLGAGLGGGIGYLAGDDLMSADYAPQVQDWYNKKAAAEYGLMKYAEAEAEAQTVDPSLFQRAYANPYARTGIGAGLGAGLGGGIGYLAGDDLMSAGYYAPQVQAWYNKKAAEDTAKAEQAKQSALAYALLGY